MGDKRKFFCAGEWKGSDDAIEIRNPYNGKLAAEVCRAGAEDIEQAVAASVEAFKETRAIPAYRREEILLNIYNALKDRAEEFAQLIASENGKPISAARVEAVRAASVFQIAAEETKRVGGECIPMDLAPGSEKRFAIFARFPLGPIYGIAPFNFPLNLVAHKVAPALAAGNSIVIKPASSTPLSALLLAEVCEKAGVPKGAMSVLPCTTELAEKMAADDRFKLLTFTGSPAIGWHLKSVAGMKPVTLELGGNAGCIVNNDADVKHAAARCAFGAFLFSGQVCISLQRIFVHSDIVEEFTGELVRIAKGMKVGDPFEDATEIGPMINENEAQRAQMWIDEAVKDGAKLLCGGRTEGAMFNPAVIVDSRPGMKVRCNEIFAPVVNVVAFDDVYEAIKMVDDSEFGLQAGIFTNDMRVISAAYRGIEAGGLMVNEVPTFRLDHMPYGGVKKSGIGREGLKYAIEEMTQQRLLVLNEV